ncbi:MAG: FtsX-like permease family protein [Planctomycetes bacterium]|nr:FtsX-like permease family protein [Planctomycetota bacterium]
MTTPWRKVLRDFWSERTRTVLVVLAIAIGISGFGAVLSTYAVLTRELNAGYLATRPASATFATDAVDDALLTALRSQPGVAEAEARRSVSGHIKVGPIEWRNLRLFVVKDYADIRIAKLTPEAGTWPPATGELWIERDALQVARAHVGDTVTLKTTQSAESHLQIGGIVHDVGQAQARMENVVYGYVTLETLAQLGEEPTLDQINIVVTGNAFDEAHVRSVASDVKAWLEGQGHAVRRMEIPKPGEHPHAAIMGLLLLAQAGFGAFALLLSGILVVNLLTALMSSQIRQIGMMKAVGGTRGQIARIYFSEALLLGIAALVIAVPAAMVGSRVLCTTMAVFLNFDVTSFAVPSWVYALEVAVGLVVPLLAAAVPVWKGSRISVREALAHYDVSSIAFGVSRVDRLVAGVGGTMRPLLLAIRNAFRRRGRVALTVVTLAMAGLFFLSARNMRASMIHTLDRLFETKRFDLSLILGTMIPMEKVERATRNTPDIVRAEGWIATEASVPRASDAHEPPASTPAGLHGGGHASGASDDDRFTVLGVPIETEMLRPHIVEGRGLQADDDNAMVVNSALVSSLPQLVVGAEVNLQMGPSLGPWRIVGIAREPFSPRVAYVPRSFFEVHGGHAGMTNSVRLVLDPADAHSIDAIKARLDENLEKEGIRALACTSTADGRFGFDQHMAMIYVFLVVVSCVLVGVGGLGLMTTMSLSVLERRREMGVLRAIGASPAMVWLIVVAEGIVIGFLSFVLAAVVAWPVSKVVGDVLVTLMLKTGLDFFFDPLGLVIWLSVSIVLSTVASFVPAWQASRCSVREAIGYE